MSYELNNEDKISILNNLIKNLKFNKFSIQKEYEAENSIASPSEALLESLEIQINNLSQKISYLESQLDAII